MSDDDRQRMLVEWNASDADFPRSACVLELISAHASQSADRAAVIFDGHELSYRNLDEQANQLSHLLRQVGVGPETVVAIAAEPSLEMVVGIVAILKAGGAYLPIDPRYPHERIKLMLDECAPQAILTTADAALTHASRDVPIIKLDADWPTIARQDPSAPPSSACPDNLAYIIYTSGSSGRPKGVMIEHRGLCDMAIAHVRQFNVHPKSRVLQFSSLSFDASVSEIFMTLVAGATLCLAPRQRLLPGRDLIQTLTDLEITNVLLPPSVLVVLPTVELPKLQTLISGGERCTHEIVRRWSRGHEFFNAYGPTEATVTAVTMRCDDTLSTDPPIGRPRANAQAYVLDDDLTPAPVGVDGELYLGGVGLARGYINSPDLTAERFIPHPFTKLSGARLYKTGDVVRWRADGVLEFVGRADRQIKLRGFRVELDEIEACLLRHPLVSHAAVVLAGRTLTDRKLVAYVKSRADNVVSDAELRKWLDSQLPDYMAPALFVPLTLFPLTPSGKTDYAALLERAQSHSIQRDHASPRTPLEKVLTEIWQEVFTLDKIGIHDHFVELGGDSLTCALVVRRASETGITLEAQQLFDYPTIAELAAAITRPNG